MANIQKIQNNLTVNLIKSIVFMLIAAGVVVGNFFVENKYALTQEMTQKQLQNFDYKNDNILQENAVIRFDQAAENDLVVLKPNIFDFKEGKLWADYSRSSANVNFLVEGRIVIIPKQATFDLAYNGTKLDLHVYDGDVYIGFLEEDIVAETYMDEYDPVFMNRMLVPKGNQVAIPAKKIDERIAPLLYSKLVKEFKYASINSKTLESEWVSVNLQKDKTLADGLKQQFASNVIKKGAQAREGFLNSFLFWSEENLSFIPEKKNAMLLNHLFAYLDDAILAASSGDKESMEVNFTAFDRYMDTLPTDENLTLQVNEKLDIYWRDLLLFEPDEGYFPVYKFITEKKLKNIEAVYEVMPVAWSNIYSAAAANSTLALETLDAYYKDFEKTLKQLEAKDSEKYRMYLTYQSQLFDNLLLDNAVFYRDAYFSIKHNLEQNLLKLYEDGQLKDELKQAFISNKINFLKRLKVYFFAGELDVRETKEIFRRLVSNVNDLMPQKNSQLAVIELFEQQLADIDDFWGFLGSTEYHSNIHGVIWEERYETYIKERDTILSFIDLTQDVLGEVTDKKMSEFEIIQKIEATLKANSQVGDLEVGKLESLDQRYVKVNLVLGGYPVEAQFDRDGETLKDVKVYGELITENAVRLDSLLAILQEKFADLAGEIKAGDEEITLETAAQRIAKAFVVKKLAAVGLSVEMKQVTIINEKDFIYRVEGVILKTGNSAKITFDFAMNGELATNVFVMKKGDPQVLNGEYSLQQVADMADPDFDFSTLEDEENRANSSEEDTEEEEASSNENSDNLGESDSKDLGITDDADSSSTQSEEGDVFGPPTGKVLR
ncbi:MAG: hypothetical protein AAB373_03955 [Patescibacteria group bacterium]